MGVTVGGVPISVQYALMIDLSLSRNTNSHHQDVRPLLHSILYSVLTRSHCTGTAPATAHFYQCSGSSVGRGEEWCGCGLSCRFVSLLRHVSARIDSGVWYQLG